MIYSMTAFARTEIASKSGKLTCEIRSVNHRYLEVGVNVPDFFRVFEMPIRDKIRQTLGRGKVDCMIRYQSQATSDMNASLDLNESLLTSLLGATQKVSTLFKTTDAISPIDVLQFPGVIKLKEVDVEAIKPFLLELIDKAIAELVAVRAREGKELARLFNERFDLIREELQKVRERLPHIIPTYEERLLKRLADIQKELDPARLEQEMLMLAQKIDVSEEIDRTETHIAEFRRIIAQGGSVGRRLDFLLQELNREANTLGSKSVDAAITHAAVEMKVLIEQVREQVQNIE